MAVKKSFKIFGQELYVLEALVGNVVSWIVRLLAPSLLPKLLPAIEQEDTSSARAVEPASANASTSADATRCVIIGRPGGREQLREITLKPGVVTCGYNIPGHRCPFSNPIRSALDLPPDCVVLKNHAFSVNYADCIIRWGLYESSLEFVGYPICPGFDVAGVVEQVGSAVTEFAVGDRVFGCSLFGAYSSRVLVPALQLRKIPSNCTLEQAVALPAVSLTSLYALYLGGQYPSRPKFNNKAILIHSAAGGVGGMLVQMAKLQGLSPVVGVVGRTSKVEAAKALGCDVVIDKSQQDLWKTAEKASPEGYACIMDASGVATLQESYNHLALSGRLVVYGFHSNLPVGKDSLSPLEWLKMGQRMAKMPKFDPMKLVTHSKSIMGFNLSFFAEERDMLTDLFAQISEWVEKGQLQLPRTAEMKMSQIGEAHDLLQSGTTIGKIVLTT